MFIVVCKHYVSSLTLVFKSASVKISKGHGFKSLYNWLLPSESTYVCNFSPIASPNFTYVCAFMCMCSSLCLKNRCVILNSIAQAFKGGSTDFSSFQHVSTLTVLNEWNVNMLLRLHWIQWSNTMESVWQDVSR